MATAMTASPTAVRQHHKRNRVALYEASGMTEDDRRRVRLEQRRLHSKIEHGVDNIQHHGNDDDDDDESKPTTMGVLLAQARSENNKLFDNVRYTREAVLDADNAGLIAEKTLHEVDKLRQVARFDAEKLIRALRSKLVTQERRLDWKLLGVECGICFNAPPTGVRFLAGSIDVETTKVVRKRRKIQRRTEDDTEEVRPEVVAEDANRKTADTLSAAEKGIKELEKVLKKRSVEEIRRKMEAFPNPDEHTEQQLREHAKEVDGVQLLMNPRSFTQSVENIFNLSFLVKKASAAVGVRPPLERPNGIKQPGFYVYRVHSDEKDERVGEATQAVLSFTMKDWRRLCEAYKLEKGDLPHRTGSRHARASQQSQE